MVDEHRWPPATPGRHPLLVFTTVVTSTHGLRVQPPVGGIILCNDHHLQEDFNLDSTRGVCSEHHSRW